MPRTTTPRSKEDPVMDRLAAMIMAASTAMDAAMEILEERYRERSKTATTVRRRRRRRRGERGAAE